MDFCRNVRITNTYFTGHPTVVWPRLVRSISQICRTGRGVDVYYIGIASGYDHYQALGRRIDERKVAYGTTDMYLLYHSTAERYTKRLEDWLIDHFQEVKADMRVWNSAPGGGGRPSTGPNYYLYLATSKLAPLR